MTPREKIEALQRESQQKISNQLSGKKAIIFVGSATCEDAAGATDSYTALNTLLKEKGLDTQFLIKRTGCTGRCDKEPIFQVVDMAGHSIVYQNMTENKMKEFVEKHLEKNELVKEWIL